MSSAADAPDSPRTAAVARRRPIAPWVFWPAATVVVGLALAYAIHRRGRPITIRWGLEPLFGKRVHGATGNVIDAVALVGTLFGVATSLGLGVSQIGSGLESIGVPELDTTMQIGLIVVISAAVLVSVQSIGAYIQDFVGLSFTAITAALASALLLAGGLTALQTAAIIIALPFSVIMLLMCWSTILAFQRERRAYARAQRAQFVEHIGTHYGLEVEEPNMRGLDAPWRMFGRRRVARAAPERDIPHEPDAPRERGE